LHKGNIVNADYQNNKKRPSIKSLPNLFLDRGNFLYLCRTTLNMENIMKTQLSKLALAVAIGLVLTFTFSCSSDDDGGNEPSGGMSSSSGDSDNNKCNSIATCKTKQIGSQNWLAENLNIDVSGSVCFGNDPANCTKYGRLYNWATAMALPPSCNSSSCASKIKAKHQGICPSGWHIPSDDDWDELISYVESSNGCGVCAGRYLKATSGWNDYNIKSGNGDDKYGFTALPGGYGSSDGSFNYVGDYGNWWSSNESNSYYAYYRFMYYNRELVGYINYGKDYLHSVRCLQN